MEIEVNNKKADLRKARPLTLGDMCRLKEIGVDFNTFKEEKFDPIQYRKFAHYVLAKANPDMTLEDAGSLSFTQAAAVVEYVSKSEENIDRPT